MHGQLVHTYYVSGSELPTRTFQKLQDTIVVPKTRYLLRDIYTVHQKRLDEATLLSCSLHSGRGRILRPRAALDAFSRRVFADVPYL